MTGAFKQAILDAHAELEGDDKPRGTKQVIRLLREAKKYKLSDEDRGAVERAGWSVLVSNVLQDIRTAAGRERKVMSVPAVTGRDWKQLELVFLEDALGVLQMYESQERAASIQARGWRQIVAALSKAPEGTSVADLFPSEAKWDSFWSAIRDSELG